MRSSIYLPHIRSSGERWNLAGLAKLNGLRIKADLELNGPILLSEWLIMNW